MPRADLKRIGWDRVIVAATGPSLSEAVAERCRARSDHKILVVNDAWRLLPWADALYASNRVWWELHAEALKAFKGERWTSTNSGPFVDDDKAGWARREELGVQLIQGKAEEGFSLVPGVIHYGNNSGFQGINLALQFGAREVRLVGFDMRRTEGKSHFFGEHPPELQSPGTIYEHFVADFARATLLLPAERRVIQCSPDSALRCFPFEEL